MLTPAQHSQPEPRASLSAALAALWDWRLLVLLLVCAGGLLLASQVPVQTHFRAGLERGPLSDQPFLQNFNAPENDDAIGRWRWSRAAAGIVVPGLGERPALVGLNIVSHRAQWLPDAPPTVLTLQYGTLEPVAITLRPEAARYQLYVPAAGVDAGRLHIELRAEQWQNPVDRRENLGVAIGERVSVATVALPGGGWVWPGWPLLGGWLALLVLSWQALAVLRFRRGLAFGLLLVPALAAPLGLLLDAPRLAFGNAWAWQMGALTLAAALVCQWSVPPLLRWLRLLPPPGALAWLLLMMVLGFVLKYAARLYPASMPGDLQLHVNRYMMTALGDVYIPAQHRGLPFPFPNGLYVMVAPFELTGYGMHFWFEFTAGIIEASVVLLLYLLAVRLTGSVRLGLTTAAVYTLAAGSYMVSWFAFETQVAGQWVTLLLVTVLAFCWPQRRDWLVWAVVFMLFVQVFLGHIGQFINLSAVGLLIIPLLWWRAQTAEEYAGVRWLLGVGLAAAAFVSVFYYTAFMDMIVEQTLGVTTQGLNDLTGRAPIPREVTLQVLWEGGAITHFGFFPVLLALVGTVVLAEPRFRRSVVPPVVWLSFLVSFSQAVLPLITLNSITTRWLMFSAWAIVLTSAWGFLLLWRRGRSGRVVTLAMAGYVGWVALEVWLNALLLRLPPVEPF